MKAMLALCLVAVVAVFPHVGATLGTSQRDPGSKKASSRTIGRTLWWDNPKCTIRRRTGALPRAPDRIEVVAADEVLPEIRERVDHMFGFVLNGSRTIYLIRDSSIIREAERSGGPYVFMLAAIIWHEMAHVDGLDEAQARRREEELWRSFVATRVVDSVFGLAYLAELRSRK